MKRTTSLPEELKTYEKLSKKPTLFLKYLIIPIEIINDSRLSWFGRALLSLIYVMQHPEHGCFASNTYIGRCLSVNAQTISNHINKLERCGYLNISNPKNKYRQIRIVTTYNNHYMLPITDVITNTNTILPSISKDIDISQSEVSKNFDVKPNKFIDYWNNIKNIPFKHLYPEKKGYKECIKYFKRLQKGTFETKSMDLSNLITKHPETKKLLNKEWSDYDIKQALLSCSKLYLDAYWPPNKSKLPNSLSQLIYNNWTKFSFFILQGTKGPKQQEKLKTKIIKKDKHKSITKLFIDLIDKELSIYDHKILITNLSDIYIYHFKMRHIPVIDSELGRKDYPMKFCGRYIEWLKWEYENWDKPFTVNMIGLESNNWSNWIKFCKNEWNI